MGPFELKRTLRCTLGRVAPITWRFKPKPSLVILAYHRVLPQGHPDREIEQPGMWVSPTTFAMHLTVLSKYFEFVDLGNWLAQSKIGDTLPDRSCAITFDDGWRDNYSYAFPLLRQARVPATVFLVSEFIGGRYSFWPNRLARLCRRLDVGGLASLPTQLQEAIRKTGVSEHNVTTAMSVDQIDRVISTCKTMPDARLHELLDEAERLTGGNLTAVSESFSTSTRSPRCSNRQLIRYGSHTKRHTRLLMEIPATRLYDEVSGSKLELEALLGEKVDLFCYPNGDYSDDAVDLVRRSYTGAVTTGSGWNYKAADPCRLRRVTLHEGSSSDEPSLLGRVGCIAAGLMPRPPVPPRPER